MTVRQTLQARLVRCVCLLYVMPGCFTVTPLRQTHTASQDQPFIYSFRISVARRPTILSHAIIFVQIQLKHEIYMSMTVHVAVDDPDCTEKKDSFKQLVLSRKVESQM